VLSVKHLIIDIIAFGNGKEILHFTNKDSGLMRGEIQFPLKDCFQQFLQARPPSKSASGLNATSSHLVWVFLDLSH
jgi:hypothetical protein